jgi:hypothetical protein
MFKIVPYDFVELPTREFSTARGCEGKKKAPTGGVFFLAGPERYTPCHPWPAPSGPIALSDENAMFEIVPYDFVELPYSGVLNVSGCE